MPGTYNKEPYFSAEYRKAQTAKPAQETPNTNPILPTQRSVATSKTDGTIQVMVVNKEYPERNIDTSTS